MNSSKPFANTRLPKFIEKRILELRPRKTQSEIAIKAGFTRPNVLSMIKTGSIRLPLDRVPALADALEVDPSHLFNLALEQMGGGTTEGAVRRIFRLVVSENESEWLNEIREASGHSDPRMTSRARSAIRAIFGG
jgi:hypothetical protein